MDSNAARRPVTPRWMRAPWPRQWTIVIAATAGMMAAFSVNASVAVFLKPFEQEFGWPRADISFAYALLSAGAALGGLIAGWTFDRVDTRPIAVFGALVLGFGFLSLAWTDDLRTIQYIYLAVGIFGFACLYTPLLAIVGLWFDRRRGLAMGIVTAGGTLGQGLTPAVVQPLIEMFGWRHACLILGIGYLLLLAPLMLLVTKPPARQANERREAQTSSQGWALPPLISVSWPGLAALLCCASMAIPIVHLVALLVDRGLSSAVTGSLILTLMTAASAGRITFGMISDRIGPLRSYALAVFAQTATVYWFVELHSIAALYVLAIAFGFGYGAVMTTLTLSVRAAVPARSAGLSLAVVGLLAWSGMGLGGYQGGYCFDLTGNYAVSFASAALAGALNLAILSGLALHLRWHSHIASAIHRRWRPQPLPVAPSEPKRRLAPVVAR
jgi:MFS family permease